MPCRPGPNFFLLLVLAVAVRVTKRDHTGRRRTGWRGRKRPAGDGEHRVDIPVRRDGHVPGRRGDVGDHFRAEPLRQRQAAVVWIAGGGTGARLLRKHRCSCAGKKESN